MAPVTVSGSAVGAAPQTRRGAVRTQRCEDAASRGRAERVTPRDAASRRHVTRVLNTTLCGTDAPRDVSPPLQTRVTKAFETRHVLTGSQPTGLKLFKVPLNNRCLKTLLNHVATAKRNQNDVETNVSTQDRFLGAHSVVKPVRFKFLGSPQKEDAWSFRSQIDVERDASGSARPDKSGARALTYSRVTAPQFLTVLYETTRKQRPDAET